MEGVCMIGCRLDYHLDSSSGNDQTLPVTEFSFSHLLVAVKLGEGLYRDSNVALISSKPLGRRCLTW